MYNPWCMRIPLGGCTIVQPMTHGVDILLYNPWVMGWMHHCTAHDPWGEYTVVQSMGHGANTLLYNPWCMGECILLYNPWCMEGAYCCTAHDAWGRVLPQPLYNPSLMGNNSSMHHGLYNGYHLHGSWAVQCSVQRLYGPWPMRFSSPRIPHDPWGKNRWTLWWSTR